MLPSPFDRLPPSAIRERALGAQSTVFRQGDTVDAIFLVDRGEIRLVRHTAAGSAVPIFRAGPGDTFAEAALFSDQYHCDAIAATHSEILIIGKAAILRAMAEDASFGMALVRRLAGQVQTYRRRLELLAISSAEERVFAALADGWLTGSVIDFATEIGLSHEATYRAMSRLVRQGRAEKLGRGRYRATGHSP